MAFKKGGDGRCGEYGKNLIPNSERTPNQKTELGTESRHCIRGGTKKEKDHERCCEDLMDMKVTGNNKENLQKMGFAEEYQNYQSAVVVVLCRKQLLMPTRLPSVY